MPNNGGSIGAHFHTRTLVFEKRPTVGALLPIVGIDLVWSVIRVAEARSALVLTFFLKIAQTPRLRFACPSPCGRQARGAAMAGGSGHLRDSTNRGSGLSVDGRGVVSAAPRGAEDDSESDTVGHDVAASPSAGVVMVRLSTSRCGDRRPVPSSNGGQLPD